MSDIVFCALLVFALCLIGCDRHEDPRFTPQIEGASFDGADRAWLTIKWGELLRTDDGGKSWRRTKIGENGFVQLSFIDSKRGWAVNIKGQVWRSLDGGETWAVIGKIEPPTGIVLSKAQQMHFTDENKGWIVDSFSVWCTEDGGANWIRCFPANKNERGIGWPHRYFQLTQRIGWIAATNGEVYQTQDGKRSWQRLSLAQESEFTDIFFIDERTGWLTGEPDGGIYKTDDGGKTWNAVLKQTSNNNIGVDSIYFLNKSEGWAVGRVYPEDVTQQATRGVVLHTTDGGANWQTVPVGEGEL